MIIVYGFKKPFVREGSLGSAVCPNCGHNAPRTLARQYVQAHVFYIPIFRKNLQRGIMCESCGIIEPLSAAEYKERKQTASY